MGFPWTDEKYEGDISIFPSTQGAPGTSGVNYALYFFLCTRIPRSSIVSACCPDSFCIAAQLRRAVASYCPMAICRDVFCQDTHYPPHYYNPPHTRHTIPDALYSYVCSWSFSRFVVETRTKPYYHPFFPNAAPSLLGRVLTRTSNPQTAKLLLHNSREVAVRNSKPIPHP